MVCGDDGILCILRFLITWRNKVLVLMPGVIFTEAVIRLQFFSIASLHTRLIHSLFFIFIFDLLLSFYLFCNLLWFSSCIHAMQYGGHLLAVLLNNIRNSVAPSTVLQLILIMRYVAPCMKKGTWRFSWLRNQNLLTLKAQFTTTHF